MRRTNKISSTTRRRAAAGGTSRNDTHHKNATPPPPITSSFLYSTRVGVVLFPTLLLALSYAGIYSQLMFLCGLVLTHAIMKHAQSTTTAMQEASLVVTWTSCLLTCLCILGHFYSAVRYSLWNFLWAQNLILVLVLFGTWQALQAPWIWQESPRTARLMERILFGVCPFPCTVIGTQTILGYTHGHGELTTLLVLGLVTIMFIVFSLPVGRSDLLLAVTDPTAAMAESSPSRQRQIILNSTRPHRFFLRKPERILSTDIEVILHVVFLFGLPPILYAALYRYHHRFSLTPHTSSPGQPHFLLMLASLILFPIVAFRFLTRGDLVYDLTLLLPSSNNARLFGILRPILEQVWVATSTLLIVLYWRKSPYTNNDSVVIDALSYLVLTNWLYVYGGNYVKERLEKIIITSTSDNTATTTAPNYHKKSPATKHLFPESTSVLLTEDHSNNTYTGGPHRLRTLVAVVAFARIARFSPPGSWWWLISVPFLLDLAWLLMTHGKLDVENLSFALAEKFRIRAVMDIVACMLTSSVLPILVTTFSQNDAPSIRNAEARVCLLFGISSALASFHPRLYTVLRLAYVTWLGVVTFATTDNRGYWGFTELMGFALAALYGWWLVNNHNTATTHSIDFVVIVTCALVPGVTRQLWCAVNNQPGAPAACLPSSITLHPHGLLITIWGLMSVSPMSEFLLALKWLNTLGAEFEWRILLSSFICVVASATRVLGTDVERLAIVAMWCFSMVVHFQHYGSSRIRVPRHQSDVNGMMMMFGAAAVYCITTRPHTWWIAIAPCAMVVLVGLNSSLVLANRLVLPCVMFYSLGSVGTTTHVYNDWLITMSVCFACVFVTSGMTMSSSWMRAVVLALAFVFGALTNLAARPSAKLSSTISNDNDGNNAIAENLLLLCTMTICMLVARDRAYYFRETGFAKEARDEMMLARWTLAISCIEFHVWANTMDKSEMSMVSTLLLRAVPFSPMLAWWWISTSSRTRHQQHIEEDTQRAFLSLLVVCLFVGSGARNGLLLSLDTVNVDLLLWCTSCWCLMTTVLDRLKGWTFTAFSVAVPLQVIVMLVGEAMDVKIWGWYGLGLWVWCRWWTSSSPRLGNVDGGYSLVA